MKWFIVLIVLLTCTGKPVSSSCDIEVSPPKVVVRFGEPFSLNCSSTSNQIDSMGWEAIYGTGTGLREGVSSVALKIDSVKDWDIAPQCFVNLRNDQQCSQVRQFTVYKMPDGAFISQPNPMGPMSKLHKLIVLYSPVFAKPENETLELTAQSKIILNCTATGNPMPVYSWGFAHPMQLTEKNPNDSQPILTPSIQLPGTYNCTVSNTQGSSTKYFTVNEPPSNHTTFAAVVGGFVFLGAGIFICGLLFVRPDGSFSFSKAGYL
ncbi:hypothetical protein PBY51_007734 [Eleginops maclovinus]|uniref:Ig-like domain-containing protein n=1 Tax=Eleginops maclovinus TaxID=56733 RepID=A0AAN7X5V0_ELEMC|nr:hypothetical protein PBY51_007734 [Eleginops maclovinus]